MVDRITSGGPAGVTPAAAAGASGPARAPAPPSRDATLPASPPPDVLADVEHAARALAEMAAKQVELHFTVDGANRVHVQVRDGQGRIVREIPASRAIDLLTGSDGAIVDRYG